MLEQAIADASDPGHPCPSSGPPPAAMLRPRFRSLAGLVVIGLAAAGCSSTPGEGSAVTISHSAPAGFGRERVIGRWGIASFHNEKDRKRTEEQARAQCNLPYAITQGPTDGVMMHVADDPKLYELKLKGGPGGKTYLGFEAPAGDPQDREILSVTDKLLTMRFVDPDANRRYGTFIFVRCAG